VREEVACLLLWSPGVAGSRLHDAADLVDRLPNTLAELEAGRFSLWHALALVDATRPLDPSQTAEVEKRVLSRAGEQTLANFRRCVHRAVQRVDTRRAEQKHTDAAESRRVVMCPEREGMASLYAYLPAPDAQRIMDRLNQTLDTSKGLDERSVDQRRADALVELITSSGGGSGTAGHAEVQITLSLDTLRGISDEPGELAGYGPLPAAIAAQFAHTWATDPSTRVRTAVLDNHRQAVAPEGIDDAATTYRPGARLHEFIVTRDRTCRFPGCHRRGSRCEIDHIIAFDGTNTVHTNLHCLCPRHHHLKEEAGWHVARAPDGVTHWTTPTGQHYEKPPDEVPIGCSQPDHPN
jgi:hypothetical protein